MIVGCTNKNAEKARENPAASRAGNIRFHESFNQRLWHPVISDEILAYFGILIYMGIHREPHVNHYWNIRAKKVRSTSSYATQWVRLGGIRSIDIYMSGILLRTRLPSSDKMAKKHALMRKLTILRSFSYHLFNDTGSLAQISLLMSASKALLAELVTPLTYQQSLFQLGSKFGSLRIRDMFLISSGMSKATRKIKGLRDFGLRGRKKDFLRRKPLCLN